MILNPSANPVHGGPRCVRWRDFARCVVSFGGWLCILSSPASTALPGVEHVVVIGVDGLNPNGIRQADTPNLDQLVKTGAHTFRARAVMPTSSSPNWASMIMGAGPDHHGVTSNDWQPYKFDLAPKVIGPGGIFPTVFGVMRGQRPEAVIAVFHDWKDFGRLLETNAPNVLKHVKDAIETTQAATEYLKQKKPNFLFIHFDGVDHSGHAFGWTSPQYYKTVELTDSLIGAVLDALSEAGLTEKTIVLVTADHGGKGKKHGGDSLEEVEVPWILKGPGVAPGREIAATVNTFDTAPTIAYIFGLKTPDCWIGKPVREAFVDPDATK
jgi:predicted AlkP superfamily pyrophosphatase or phosphodiesterase